MIMLLTHQAELREQLSAALEANGHAVAIPPHRNDMIAMMKESHPHLIVLDLYLKDPSGAEDMKILRDQGYEGTIIVLSGPSMMPVLKEAYASGVASVVELPAKINGRFDLGDLQSTIRTSMAGTDQTRNTDLA